MTIKKKSGRDILGQNKSKERMMLHAKFGGMYGVWKHMGETVAKERRRIWW